MARSERMGGPEGHVAEAVDQFLAAPKERQGVGTWRDVGQHGEARGVFPILVDGEASSCASASYELKAYPRKRPLQFRVVLGAPSAVWRVDFGREACRVNPLGGQGRPHDRPRRTGARRHHAWGDDRCLASSRTLPRDPPNAPDLCRRR